MQMNMKEWGVTESIEKLASSYPDLTIGRVITQEKGQYRVVHVLGEQAAVVSGRYRHEATTVSAFPTVGDFVLLSLSDNSAVIHELLPRKSVFIRKAAGSGSEEQVVAANADIVFLCMSLNRDFNLRRLERYLSIAWESGATPVVLLTKADLCSDIAEKQAEVASVATGVDVLTISSVEENGIDAVLPYFTVGTSCALIGSSGVGKSTLLNRLLGAERIKTDGLRNDDKGRHTTTHRELLQLPSGGLMIDTPGMRELGLWDANEGVEKTFADIEALADSCRFRNCTHQNEPGCAVRAALENGTLFPQRWASYQKLSEENAHSQHGRSYLAAKELKFKEIAKRNRNNRKK